MQILNTTVRTKAEADAAILDLLSHLDVDGLKKLAVAAYGIGSGAAGYTFAGIMKVLAARFDKRSFVNICEDIHRTIREGAA